mmetsp:Transcript_45393/g.89236  ORF Transcript_45393/g.89236 Transcript_45393/m.89236 type:complete len:444 (+) Transcript_45393:379-1710(+)
MHGTSRGSSFSWTSRCRGCVSGGKLEVVASFFVGKRSAQKIGLCCQQTASSRLLCGINFNLNFVVGDLVLNFHHQVSHKLLDSGALRIVVDLVAEALHHLHYNLPKLFNGHGTSLDIFDHLGKLHFEKTSPLVDTFGLVVLGTNAKLLISAFGVALWACRSATWATRTSNTCRFLTAFAHRNSRARFSYIFDRAFASRTTAGFAAEIGAAKSHFAVGAGVLAGGALQKRFFCASGLSGRQGKAATPAAGGCVEHRPDVQSALIQIFVSLHTLGRAVKASFVGILTTNGADRLAGKAAILGAPRSFTRQAVSETGPRIAAGFQLVQRAHGDRNFARQTTVFEPGANSFRAINRHGASLLLTISLRFTGWTASIEVEPRANTIWATRNVGSIHALPNLVRSARHWHGGTITIAWNAVRFLAVSSDSPVHALLSEGCVLRFGANGS